MCGAEKVRHMLMGEQVLKKWKKSKKMTVAFGGILVMSVVIGGCGGREDAKKSIKIGISVYDQYDTFVSEMMKDFNDYATKKEEETVCGVGGRSRSSGCYRPHGIFGQHNDRQWSGSRKAGICDRKLESCTGADENGTAYVTVW